MLAGMIRSWLGGKPNDYARGIRRLSKSGVQAQIVSKITDQDAFVAIPSMKGGPSGK